LIRFYKKNLKTQFRKGLTFKQKKGRLFSVIFNSVAVAAGQQPAEKKAMKLELIIVVL